MDKKQINELVRKKCFDSKYHNSLKYMIHNCEDIKIRNSILKRVFFNDPYLGSQIYMSMCDDNAETIKDINRMLTKVEAHSKNKLKIARLLMCYLEMGEIDKFYSYYSKIAPNLYSKQYIYMARHLSYFQLLYLIDAMISCNQSHHGASCMKKLWQKYSSEHDEFLVKLICKLLEENSYAMCWKLISETRKAKNIGAMLGPDLRDQVINKMLSGSLNDTYHYNLYLSLKYGYTGYDDNKEVIARVIEDDNAILGNWCVIFYTRLLTRYELTPEQQKSALLRMGVIKEVADICIAREMPTTFTEFGRFTRIELKKIKEDPILLETRLVESLNKRLYLFSTLDTMRFFGMDWVENNGWIYDLFHKYMDTKEDAEEIVFYYFNSLYRYFIYLEYVVTYLTERFSLQEQELRRLFKGYLLYGKVIKINKNSVSIRMINVFTAKACRLSLKKVYRDREGAPIHPQIGDEFYFKFNYLVIDYQKLYLYQPTYTLERIYELKDKRT